MVTDLVSPFYGSWRGITTDNFFTSIPLANYLFEKQLTLTGTIRKNKTEIPTELAANKNREELSTIFGFTDKMTLLSYVPKKNKAVMLLTTQFNNGDIERGDKKRPDIILHYNKTKGGVDTGDKMTQEYSCVRTTRRWPFRIFMELIDIAALNAYILWVERFPEWRANDRSRRKEFIRQLSIELAKPNVDLRSNNPKHHKNLQNSINIFNKSCYPEESTPPASSLINNPELNQSSVSGPSGKPKRCAFCNRTKDRKTKTSCSQCNKAICALHREQKIIWKCPDCQHDEPIV